MRDYFFGQYYKCQAKGRTLAVIAAYHRSKGVPSCSIQLITDDFVEKLSFPAEAWAYDKGSGSITVGGSRFDKRKMTLDIPELGVSGQVFFAELTPIRYDIMGPFRFVPFMECRHSVISMRHTLSGEVSFRGERFDFTDGLGYIEGDRGYSFPDKYIWTQSLLPARDAMNASLMLSVASIPFGLFDFTGIIGVVHIDGKEYRIATYLGARAVSVGGSSVEIKQGKYRLYAELVKKNGHPLLAPTLGSMTRTIHESASCTARYRLTENGKTLFDTVTDAASFEFEWGK